MSLEPRFLQIHTLTPYAGALLNRDDVGRAKRLPFGGAERIRVSSQCLKRHWRTAAGAWSLADLAPLSVRSRLTFVREIAEPLAAEYDPAAVKAVVEAFQAVLLGESAKARAEKEGRAGDGADAALDALETGQVLVLGRPEVEFIREAARTLLEAAVTPTDARRAVEAHIKQTRANLEALRMAAGLDGALFGRMVTSDILARGDAAVHVAHSFTVHAEESEPEFFTAVDDLLKDGGGLGSGMVGESELTSGLFYGYVVVDLPLLVANLEGCDTTDWLRADRTLAAKVVEHLVQLIASVSPGAKLGSTAPYAYADTVLLELGRRQPRTLANAFLKPVAAREAEGGLRAAALARLDAHLRQFDRVYGAGEARRAVGLDLPDGFAVADAGGLDALCAWAADAVRTGAAEAGMVPA